MNFSRRRLLATVPLASVAAALALSGCGQSAATITADIVTDLGDVETGLTELSPVLTTIPGITSTALSSVQGYFTQAINLAKSVSTTTVAATGQSTISQIETYVTDGLSLLSGLPLPSGVSVIVSALQVALPFVEAAATALTSLNVGATPNPAGAAALTVLANSKTILKAS